MMPRRRAPAFHLSTFKSTTGRTEGLEVSIEGDECIDSLIGAINWVSASAPGAVAPSFVMLDLPRGPESAELERIAQAAESAGLLGKLCLVCRSGSDSLADTVRDLQGLGIRVILGGVGPNSRLADLSDANLDGLLLDRSFVNEVSGEPRAVCMLAAVTNLARSLGIRTFASSVSESSAHVMGGSGVDYISLVKPVPGSLHVLSDYAGMV